MPGVMTPATTGSWVLRLRPNPAARIRLFCFPYAGGSARIFHGWPELLPPDVEVYAIQPPGREVRIKEAPITRLLSLVRLVAPEVLAMLDRPFIFFGHSLGALVAFELARELRRTYALHPESLLISGHRAPQLQRKETSTHTLPDPLLIKELGNMNGTPASVLQNAELMRLLLPTLRADLAACETYKYAEERPLACRLTVYGGADDTEIPLSMLDAWKYQTIGPFRVEVFSGDHFFIHSMKHELLRSISRELHRVVAALALASPVA